MITWAQELTMMHRAIHLPLWRTVLMEPGYFDNFYTHAFSEIFYSYMRLSICFIYVDLWTFLIGYSRAGQIKKEIHT